MVLAFLILVPTHADPVPHEVWTLENGRLPIGRVHGYAHVGEQTVVGGMEGLYIGHPGDWKVVSEEPVREVRQQGDVVWVLYGSGAVDKMEPRLDRLYPDVLHEAARRPWTASLGFSGPTVFLGGHGGWVEKGKSLSEKTVPELEEDVVTAIDGDEKTRWVGTQKNGLYRFSGSGKTVWNPANGLIDTWVTSLLHTREGLFVGTGTDGLYLLRNAKIFRTDCPARRHVLTRLWDAQVVVGDNDGAWIQQGSEWKPIPIGRNETTFLTTDGSDLVVGTARGVYFVGDGAG